MNDGNNKFNSELLRRFVLCLWSPREHTVFMTAPGRTRARTFVMGFALLYPILERKHHLLFSEFGDRQLYLKYKLIGDRIFFWANRILKADYRDFIY